MPLSKQVFPVLLGQLDTKTDPKVAPAGTLTEVSNLLMTSPGRYDKRPGFASSGLANVGAAPAFAIGTDTGVVAQAAGGKIYSVQSMPTPAWRDNGACPIVGASGSTVYASSGDQSCGDVCYGDGLLTYVYENFENGNDLRYTVIDRATGTYLVTHAICGSSGASTRPKCVYYGGYVYIFTVLNTALHVQRFATSNPSSITAVTAVLASAIDLDGGYDVAVVGSVAYIGIAKTDRLWIGRWDLANHAQLGGGVPSALTYTTNGTQASVCELAHDYSDGKAWWAFFYTASDNNQHMVIASCAVPGGTLTQLMNVTQTGGSGGATFSASDKAWQMAGHVDDATGNKVVYAEMNNSKQIVTLDSSVGVIKATNWGRLLDSACILSKAFKVGGYAYWRMGYAPSGTAQPTAFLMRQDLIPVARSHGSVSAGSIARLGCASSVAPVGGGAYVAAATKRTAVTTNGTTYTFTKSMSSVEWTPGKVAGRPVVAGGVILMPGGVVQQYDGSRSAEVGFHLYPEAPTLASSGAGGNLAAGTYWYQAVFEWYDAQGRRHQSTPSIPKSVTLAGLFSVNITVGSAGQTLPLGFTSKNIARVAIVFYRTVKDAPQNATYYRTSALVYANTGAATVNDNTSDATLVSREPLYVQDGSVLENEAPPPSNVLHVYGNRVWAVNAEDPSEIWPSKDIKDARGIAFSEPLKVRQDDAAGGFTALSDLEDRLVAFKKRGIYYLSGDGPDDAGNGAWGQLQRLAGSIGTSEPQSVLKLEGSVYFRAADGLGFHRLDGAGGVSYVGAQVESSNGETIIGAVYVPGRRLACWACASGKVLVYDPLLTRWYVWTTGLTVSAVALYGGELALFDASGNVYVMTPGTWADNGAAIVSAVETSWISASGIGGLERFYRVQIFGTYYGAHTLSVTMTFNFGATSKTVSKAIDLTVLPDGSYRAEAPVPLAMQEATAMKVRIADSFPGGASQGAGLSAIGILVGLKPGRTRLPSARTLT